MATISIFCYGFWLIWLMMMLLFWMRQLTCAPWFILSACLWKHTCWRCCKITVLTWLVVLSCTRCLYALRILQHFVNTYWGQWNRPFWLTPTYQWNLNIDLTYQSVSSFNHLAYKLPITNVMHNDKKTTSQHAKKISGSWLKHKGKP